MKITGAPIPSFDRRRLDLIAIAIAIILLTGYFLPAPARASNSPAVVEPLPTLTLAQQVRELSPEQARLGYPVRLRGLILDYNQRTFEDLMFQDASAGVYLGQTAAKKYRLHAGQWIEVTGLSAPGEFAPLVLVSNLVVVGEGTLPEGQPATFDRLATGTEDGQWVSIRGIIRSAVVDKSPGVDRLLIELATGGRRLTARVTDYDPSMIDRLIDAEVNITGVCFPMFNRKRQLLGVRLSVPRMDQIQVQIPPPRDPFAVLSRPINSLMQFDLTASHGHRVKVRGVVTLPQPGRLVFIRDDTQGLLVKTRQALALAPGDEIEAVGFPAAGEYSPVMEDAIVRKTGRTIPAAPIPLTAEKAREGNYDADLIRIEARLIDQFRSGSDGVLVLDEGNFIFRAQVESAAPVTFRIGSRLALTGICQVQLGDQRWPQSFRILLRSWGDAALLRAPPWWTFQRVLVALGLVTCVFLAAMVWAITLQRRVRALSREIARKAQREAVLEERTRIAREFHDTLEQQLAGIGMQLEVAGEKLDDSPGLARRILSVARGMVRHSREEARRSVWELRARALQDGDLAAALTSVTHAMESDSGVHPAVKVTGKARSLPPNVESNLLRIGQEAAANALKHAHAKSLKITLLYEAHCVRLCIEDDGRGFEMKQIPGHDLGHFGLLGMRERTEKIGGRLEVSSTPGEGTRVEATVPI